MYRERNTKMVPRITRQETDNEYTRAEKAEEKNKNDLPLHINYQVENEPVRDRM